MTRLAAILLPPLAACAGAADTGIGEDLDARACAFVGVAGMTIHAVSDPQAGGLATIAPSDEPWTIELMEAERSWLRFELDEPKTLRLYVDQAHVVWDLTHEGEPMGLPEAAPVDGCADWIPERFRLQLPQPGRYDLELRPTDSDELWLMLMAPSEA